MTIMVITPFRYPLRQKGISMNDYFFNAKHAKKREKARRNMKKHEKEFRNVSRNFRVFRV
jgi:hypothetical protein